MLKKLLNRKRDREIVLSPGRKESVSYSVVINNDDICYFDNYQGVVDFLDNYRNTNQIFNLSIYRCEFYCLT